MQIPPPPTVFLLVLLGVVFWSYVIIHLIHYFR